MKLYEINNCNASFMSDYIYQEAKTATEAVFKSFGIKTKRSADRRVDFLVVLVEKGSNGGYHKIGNQLGLCILQPHSKVEINTK